MNKKLALIISGASAILVTLVLVFYFQFRGKFSAVSPSPNPMPTPIVEEMSTWTDPADFSFDYPKSLSLNPHNEDELNYAHVELTSATHSGNLIVWVKDTTADTIDGWVTQQKIKDAIDSTLDTIPAKKIMKATESANLTLSTIYNGYLYQIEGDLVDNEFWNKIFNQVTSSFKFTSSNPDNSQDNSTGENSSGTDQESSDEEVIE